MPLMTLVILLLAVLVLLTRTGPAQSASTGQPQAEPVQAPAHREERHEVDEGLLRQRLLKPPASEPGKPSPAMTSRVHAPAKAWQARSRATNPVRRVLARMRRHVSMQRSLSAICARILSGAMLARAQ